MIELEPGQIYVDTESLYSFTITHLNNGVVYYTVEGITTVFPTSQIQWIFDVERGKLALGVRGKS